MDFANYNDQSIFLAKPFQCPDHRIGIGGGFIFGKAHKEGHKKWPPGAQKMIFFTQIYFFRVHTLHSFFVFFAKNALILVKYSLQSSV